MVSYVEASVFRSSGLSVPESEYKENLFEKYVRKKITKLK